MRSVYEKIQSKLEDEIDEMVISMELQTNSYAYFSRLDRDGWGYDPVEIGKVIAAERAVRAPHRLSLIVADKSQAELEEIAKEKLMKARENEINLLKSRLAKLISEVA
ncbi:Uncharacterised protein [Shigella sonnei]|nr:Uncharacterised protein [Shigella sonnei]